jgi:CheY-like chemotaxis protein
MSRLEGVKGRFILVAATDSAFLAVLEKTLANTPYELLLATSGQQAIDYVELLNSRIYLVVIDLDLPGVSGLHVIWRLVSRKKPKPPKIIAAIGTRAPLLTHVVKKLGVDVVERNSTPVGVLHQTILSILKPRPQGKTSSAAAGV